MVIWAMAPGLDVDRLLCYLSMRLVFKCSWRLPSYLKNWINDSEVVIQFLDLEFPKRRVDS